MEPPLLGRLTLGPSGLQNQGQSMDPPHVHYDHENHSQVQKWPVSIFPSYFWNRSKILQILDALG